MGPFGGSEGFGGLAGSGGTGDAESSCCPRCRAARAGAARAVRGRHAADTQRWARKQTPRTRDEGPLARPRQRCQAQAGRAGICRSGPFPGPRRQIPAIRPAGAGRRRTSPRGAPKGPLSRVTGPSGERRAAGRVCESAPPCKGAQWAAPTTSRTRTGMASAAPQAGSANQPRPAGARGGPPPRVAPPCKGAKWDAPTSNDPPETAMGRPRTLSAESHKQPRTPERRPRR